MCKKPEFISSITKADYICPGLIYQLQDLLGNLDHYRDWNLDRKNSVAEKTKVGEIWNSINLMTGCRPMYWFFLLIVRIILSALSVSLHGTKNWPNYENSLISMGLEPMDDEKPYTLTACALTGEL